MTMQDVGPDDGYGFIKLFAKLDVTLGEVSEQTKRHREQLSRMMDARAAETPRRARFHGTVTPGAPGFGVIGFDNNPTLGRYWNVRKLSIGGLTPSTVAAGQAFVYVTAMDLRAFTDLASIGAAPWVDSASQLPLVGDFSPGELPVQETEKLWVVIYGGTSGQQYTAQGVVDDIQLSAVTADWSV